MRYSLKELTAILLSSTEDLSSRYNERFILSEVEIVSFLMPLNQILNQVTTLNLTQANEIDQLFLTHFSFSLSNFSYLNFAGHDFSYQCGKILLEILQNHCVSGLLPIKGVNLRGTTLFSDSFFQDFSPLDFSSSFSSITSTALQFSLPSDGDSPPVTDSLPAMASPSTNLAVSPINFFPHNAVFSITAGETYSDAEAKEREKEKNAQLCQYNHVNIIRVRLLQLFAFLGISSVSHTPLPRSASFSSLVNASFPARSRVSVPLPLPSSSAFSLSYNFSLKNLREIDLLQYEISKNRQLKSVDLSMDPLLEASLDDYTLVVDKERVLDQVVFNLLLPLTLLNTDYSFIQSSNYANVSSSHFKELLGFSLRNITGLKTLPPIRSTPSSLHSLSFHFQSHYLEENEEATVGFLQWLQSFLSFDNSLPAVEDQTPPPVEAPRLSKVCPVTSLQLEGLSFGREVLQELIQLILATVRLRLPLEHLALFSVNFLDFKDVLLLIQLLLKYRKNLKKCEDKPRHSKGTPEVEEGEEITNIKLLHISTPNEALYTNFVEKLTKFHQHFQADTQRTSESGQGKTTGSGTTQEKVIYLIVRLSQSALKHQEFIFQEAGVNPPSPEESLTKKERMRQSLLQNYSNFNNLYFDINGEDEWEVGDCLLVYNEKDARSNQSQSKIKSKTDDVDSDWRLGLVLAKHASGRYAIQMLDNSVELNLRNGMLRKGTTFQRVSALRSATGYLDLLQYLQPESTSDSSSAISSLLYSDILSKVKASFPNLLLLNNLKFSSEVRNFSFSDSPPVSEISSHYANILTYFRDSLQEVKLGDEVSVFFEGGSPQPTPCYIRGWSLHGYDIELKETQTLLKTIDPARIFKIHPGQQLPPNEPTTSKFYARGDYIEFFNETSRRWVRGRVAHQKENSCYHIRGEGGEDHLSVPHYLMRMHFRSKDPVWVNFSTLYSYDIFPGQVEDPLGRLGSQWKEAVVVSSERNGFFKVRLTESEREIIVFSKRLLPANRLSERDVEYRVILDYVQKNSCLSLSPIIFSSQNAKTQFSSTSAVYIKDFSFLYHSYTPETDDKIQEESVQDQPVSVIETKPESEKNSIDIDLPRKDELRVHSKRTYTQNSAPFSPTLHRTEKREKLSHEADIEESEVDRLCENSGSQTQAYELESSFQPEHDQKVEDYLSKQGRSKLLQYKEAHKVLKFDEEDQAGRVNEQAGREEISQLFSNISLNGATSASAGVSQGLSTANRLKVGTKIKFMNENYQSIYGTIAQYHHVTDTYSVFDHIDKYEYQVPAREVQVVGHPGQASGENSSQDLNSSFSNVFKSPSRSLSQHSMDFKPGSRVLCSLGPDSEPVPGIIYEEKDPIDNIRFFSVLFQNENGPDDFFLVSESEMTLSKNLSRSPLVRQGQQSNIISQYAKEFKTNLPNLAGPPVVPTLNLFRRNGSGDEVPYNDDLARQGSFTVLNFHDNDDQQEIESLDSLVSKRDLVNLWDDREGQSQVVSGVHHERGNENSTPNLSGGSSIRSARDPPVTYSPQRPTASQSSYNSPKNKNFKESARSTRNILRTSSAPSSSGTTLNQLKSEQFPPVVEADYFQLTHDDLIQKLMTVVDINDPETAFHTGIALMQVGFTRWVDFLELPVALFPHLKANLENQAPGAAGDFINSQNYPFLSSLSLSAVQAQKEKEKNSSNNESVVTNQTSIRLLALAHLNDPSIMLSCRNLFVDAGLPLLIASKLASYIISYHYYTQTQRVSTSMHHGAPIQANLPQRQPMFPLQTPFFSSHPHPSLSRPGSNLGFRSLNTNNFYSRPPSTS